MAAGTKHVVWDMHTIFCKQTWKEISET